MALFRFPWFRRWVRRNTRPIPEPDAVKWRRRLSLAYAAIAWNAFGLVFYYAMSNRDITTKASEQAKSETQAEHYIRILNLDRVKVTRYSKFQKVEEYEYDRAAEQQKPAQFSEETALDGSPNDPSYREISSEHNHQPYFE